MRTCFTFLISFLLNIVVKDSMPKYLLVKIKKDVKSDKPLDRGLFDCKKEGNYCMELFAPCCDGLVCGGTPLINPSCRKPDDDDKCKWFGTAHFCDGECPRGWTQIKRDTFGDGKRCWTGSKAYCCKDVNGQWSTWEDYSPCSKSCGTGHETRTRACNNPPPSGGGKACPGPSSESRKCNTQDCPVDCKWGPWGEWTTCSKECGGGKKSRSRPVATPASDGGKPCEGNGTQWEDCNTQACDVDCEWGPWSEWSSCSKTCGWGVKSISRQVAKPAIHGGKPCEGPGIKREACNIQVCKDCKWGPWGEWSSCSKTCGGGRKSQSRKVATPASDDGKPCEGAVTKWQSCNKQSCPVPCEFGPWGEWSSCSKSCGCGLRTQTRPVITPALNGGACFGDKAWQSCNNQACPGDCEYGSWSGWSSCSKACGEHGGVKSRTRQISRTPSNKCGNCEGETTQTRACFEESCPEKYDDPVTTMWCKRSKDVPGRNGCMTDKQCLDNARRRCDKDSNCFGVSWFPHKKTQDLKLCLSREMEPKADGWRTMMKHKGYDMKSF